MVRNRNIKFNKIAYFLNKDISGTINDENDIKKYTGINMHCISKLNFDTKIKYTDEYMRNILSTNLKLNNMTILVMNCSKQQEKNISVDMAISCTNLNKKVLLIVIDPTIIKENKNNDSISLEKTIKKTSIQNLDIVVNPFTLLTMNDIIPQLKCIYDVIIIDDTMKYLQKNNKLLAVENYTTFIINSGETKIKDFKKLSKLINLNCHSLISIVLNKESETQIYNFESKKINKNNNFVYNKKILMRQNKRINLLKNEINELSEKIKSSKNLENIIENQKSELEQYILDNNGKIKDLIEEKNKVNIENINKIMQEIEKSKEELQEKYQQEIEKIKNEIQEKYQQEIENNKIEIQEKHQQEIENIKNEMQKDYEQKIDIIKEEIEKTKKENKKIENKDIEKIETKKENKLFKRKKTKFSIYEEIDYENLEKNACYVIPLKSKISV